MEAGILLTGATNDTIYTSETGSYYCVVNGSCSPSDISNTFTVIVGTSPQITNQSVNTSLCTGNSVNLFVTVTGSGLTYQWYNNNGLMSGKTNDTLTINDQLSTINYYCIVNGTCSPAVTSTAITVSALTLPSIFYQNDSVTTCTGNSALFIISATGSNLSYQWQSGLEGNTFSNLSNTGVYSGASTDSLYISDDTGLNNMQYRCIVSGICSPAVISYPARLSVILPPSILGQPVSDTVCNGNRTVFSVSATGGYLRYQWQSDASGTYSNLNNSGVDSNVTSSVLVISDVTGLNNTNYRCVINNSYCSSISELASLSVTSNPLISVQPLPVAVCTGNSSGFSVTATGNDISYQWQASADGITFSNLNNTGVYFGATGDSLEISDVTGLNNYQYRCDVIGTCNPAAISNAVTLTVFPLPVITVQPVSVSTCPDSTASFAVTVTGDSLTYQWLSDVSGSFENLVNGGIYSNVTTSEMNISDITGLNNTNYICIVNNASCSSTSDEASLTYSDSLVITVQPSPVITCSGNPAVFFVTATGINLTYQWQSINGRNTTNLTNNGVYSGVTSDTIFISDVTGLNDIQYLCIISGSCLLPSTSNTALLTVNVAPDITTQPVAVTKCEGTAATFSVRATGTALSYQWQSNVTRCLCKPQ